MRRRNPRPKAAETLKKKTDPKFEFTNPDASSSRAHSELKRRRSVTFVDVEHHRSPLNDSPEAQTGRSANDAKTSEFAFFKKLKSGFGLCSEPSDSKSSNKVNQNPKIFEFKSKPGGMNCESEAKDRCFSTPIHNARRGSCGLSMSPVNFTRKNKEKDPGKYSSGFSRDKDTVRGGNNNPRCGGSSDEKEDIFSVKRKRLNQWVKDTWFPEIPELTSNGDDLVSILLTRLFPGTEERHPSRFSKERTDSANRRSFLNSTGSKFLKRSHESYTEVDHSLKMEKERSISWRGRLESSIALRRQFATNNVQSSFIPRDPEEFSFSLSYPKESVYRPPLLTQKASLSFPVEETLDSSLHFRNYKPLALGYHGEEIGYGSEVLSHDHREPSSALLLEWNTENASTRKTDDLPLSCHTKLITYPNASSSSSLTDDPWSYDYPSSHSLVARELYPLPLLTHYTSGGFFLPTTNQTGYFEHEFEGHMIDEEDVVAANQNRQTFHHTNSSSDCLTRNYTYYRSPSNSPVDHCPFKVSGCEIVSFPFSSISNSNWEASSPTQSDRFKSHDWIPFKFQAPQAWVDI